MKVARFSIGLGRLHTLRLLHIFITGLFCFSLMGCPSSDNETPPAGTETGIQNSKQPQRTGDLTGTVANGETSGSAAPVTEAGTVKQPEAGLIPSFPVITKKFKLKCGENSAPIEIKINKSLAPLSQDGAETYVVVFGDNPTTLYFEDLHLPDTKNLVDKLTEQNGYRTIQVKYTNSKKQACGPEGINVTGFQAACCQQGLDAVSQHSYDVMKKVLEVSGYNDSKNPKKQLFGVGYGMGTLPLSKVAYEYGNEFKMDKVAMISPVLGDAKFGCQSLSELRDLFNSWTKMPLAWALDKETVTPLFQLADNLDMLTKTGRGCSQDPEGLREFTAKHSLAEMPYFTQGSLAVFAGDKSYDMNEFKNIGTRANGDWAVFGINMILFKSFDFFFGDFLHSHFPNFGWDQFKDPWRTFTSTDVNNSTLKGIKMFFVRTTAGIIRDYTATRAGRAIGRANQELGKWTAKQVIDLFNLPYSPQAYLYIKTTQKRALGAEIGIYEDCGNVPWNCKKEKQDFKNIFLNSDIMDYLTDQSPPESDQSIPNSVEIALPQ